MRQFIVSLLLLSFVGTSLNAEEKKDDPTQRCYDKCEQIIKAFELEVGLKDNAITRQLKYAEMLEKQRDKAYELLADNVTDKKKLPWFVWMALGSAETTLILRGNQEGAYIGAGVLFLGLIYEEIF